LRGVDAILVSPDSQQGFRFAFGCITALIAVFSGASRRRQRRLLPSWWSIRWGLFLVIVVFVLLSIECGYRLGDYRRSRSEQEKDAPVGAIVGSTLGLLTFMLFVESLNEMIDLHAKRVTAGPRNRIPGAIWACSRIAVLSQGAMGYHSGLVGTTRRSP